MRIQNTPFGSNPFTRSVAIITAALFLFTSLSSSAPAAFAAQAIDSKVQGGESVGSNTNVKFVSNPSLSVENKDRLHRLDRDREIRIPPELGLIDEIYNAPRAEQDAARKTVIFIQDAHDSLEAQENIAKIIDALVTGQGVKTVFEEGYEGPVPTDEYFGFIKDPVIKEKVSYFLMDHLRVGGAEYAHINRTQNADWQLVGADSLKLHKENISQYRLSAAKKDTITKDLTALETELKTLVDGRFPKEIKEWLKTKEQFDVKKLDLFNYLSRTFPLMPNTPGKDTITPLLSFILETVRSNDPVVIEKAKHIDAREVFDELTKIEQAIAETYLQESADRQLFEYYKILGLLRRLNDLQVSQEEYESIKVSLETFDTDSFAQFIFEQAPKTLILSRMWEMNIKDAIKFYEIAQARDNSLSDALDKYLIGATGQGPRATESVNANSWDVDRGTWIAPAPAVLVYGGFHKENIKRILEAKGISYVVVSPKITKPSSRHEEFYKKLMTEGAFQFEKNLKPLLATATRNLTIYSGMPKPIGQAEVQEVYGAIHDGAKARDVELVLNAKKEQAVGRSALASNPTGTAEERGMQGRLRQERDVPVRSEMRAEQPAVATPGAVQTSNKASLTPRRMIWRALLTLVILSLSTFAWSSELTRFTKTMLEKAPVYQTSLPSGFTAQDAFRKHIVEKMLTPYLLGGAKEGPVVYDHYRIAKTGVSRPGRYSQPELQGLLLKGYLAVMQGEVKFDGLPSEKAARELLAVLRFLNQNKDPQTGLITWFQMTGNIGSGRVRPDPGQSGRINLIDNGFLIGDVLSVIGAMDGNKAPLAGEILGEARKFISGIQWTKIFDKDAGLFPANYYPANPEGKKFTEPTGNILHYDEIYSESFLIYFFGSLLSDVPIDWSRLKYTNRLTQADDGSYFYVPELKGGALFQFPHFLFVPYMPKDFNEDLFVADQHLAVASLLTADKNGYPLPASPASDPESPYTYHYVHGGSRNIAKDPNIREDFSTPMTGGLLYAVVPGAVTPRLSKAYKTSGVFDPTFGFVDSYMIRGSQVITSPWRISGNDYFLISGLLSDSVRGSIQKVIREDPVLARRYARLQKSFGDIYHFRPFPAKTELQTSTETVTFVPSMESGDDARKLQWETLGDKTVRFLFPYASDGDFGFYWFKTKNPVRVSGLNTVSFKIRAKQGKVPQNMKIELKEIRNGQEITFYQFYAPLEKLYQGDREWETVQIPVPEPAALIGHRVHLIVLVLEGGVNKNYPEFEIEPQFTFSKTPRSEMRDLSDSKAKEIIGRYSWKYSNLVLGETRAPGREMDVFFPLNSDEWGEPSGVLLKSPSVLWDEKNGVYIDRLEKLDGESREFIDEIIKNYELAVEHLGGLFVRTKMLRDVRVEIDGDLVTLPLIIIQEKGKTVEAFLDEYEKAIRRISNNIQDGAITEQERKKLEADLRDIEARKKILEKKMEEWAWAMRKRGWIDTDENWTGNCIYDEKSERVMGFDAEGYRMESEYQDIWRQPGPEGLESIFEPTLDERIKKIFFGARNFDAVSTSEPVLAPEIFAERSEVRAASNKSSGQRGWIGRVFKRVVMLSLLAASVSFFSYSFLADPETESFKLLPMPALTSADAYIREEAFNIVWRSFEPESIPTNELESLLKHPNDDVAQSALKLLLRRNDIPITLEALKFVLNHSNPEIQKLALAVVMNSAVVRGPANDLPLTLDDLIPCLNGGDRGVVAKALAVIEIKKIPVSLEFLESYLNHKSGIVETSLDFLMSHLNLDGKPRLTPRAAARLIMSQEKLREEFKNALLMEQGTIFGLVSVSLELNGILLKENFEQLYAEALMEKLYAEAPVEKLTEPEPGLKVSAEQIKMPLLHFLQLHRDHLAALDPQAQVQWAQRAMALIRKKTQEKAEKVTILGPGRRLVAAFHKGDDFPVKSMVKLAEYFGAVVDVSKDAFKGTGFWKVKRRYLKAITELSATSVPATVWHFGHGSHDSFYFSDLVAVSYREFARALVDGQTGRREIDLSHLVIVFDACLQYDLVSRLLTEALEDAAVEKGMKVASLPTIITAANKGNPDLSFLFYDAINKVKPSRGEPLLLKHILLADQYLNQEYIAPGIWQDPAVFVPLNAKDMAEIGEALFSTDYRIPHFLEISRRDLKPAPKRILLAMNTARSEVRSTNDKPSGQQGWIGRFLKRIVPLALLLNLFFAGLAPAWNVGEKAASWAASSEIVPQINYQDGNMSFGFKIKAPWPGEAAKKPETTKTGKSTTLTGWQRAGIIATVAAASVAMDRHEKDVPEMRGVLAYDVLGSGLVASLASIRHEDQNAFDNFLLGTLAGIGIHAADLFIADTINKNEYLSGLVGVPFRGIGESMLKNITRGEGVFDRYEYPFGPLVFEWSKGSGFRTLFQAGPLLAMGWGIGARGGKLSLRDTLTAGAPVLVMSDVPNGGVGYSIAGIIFMTKKSAMKPSYEVQGGLAPWLQGSVPSLRTQWYSILNHERLHTDQYTGFAKWTHLLSGKALEFLEEDFRWYPYNDVFLPIDMLYSDVNTYTDKPHDSQLLELVPVRWQRYINFHNPPPAKDGQRPVWNEDSYSWWYPVNVPPAINPDDPFHMPPYKPGYRRAFIGENPETGNRYWVYILGEESPSPEPEPEPESPIDVNVRPDINPDDPFHIPPPKEGYQIAFIGYNDGHYYWVYVPDEPTDSRSEMRDIASTIEKYGMNNLDYLFAFLRTQQRFSEQALDDARKNLESMIGVYRHPEQPEKGFEPLLSDHDIQELAALIARDEIGLKFLFEDGLTYARSYHPHTSYDSIPLGLSSVPILDSSTGKIRNKPEIVIVDLPQSGEERNRYLYHLNKELDLSMKMLMGDGDILDLSDLLQDYLKVLNVLKITIETVKKRNPPPVDQNSAKALAKAIFLHEIGEAIYGIMPDEYKAEWGRLLTDPSAEGFRVKPGVVFFKNQRKEILQFLTFGGVAEGVGITSEMFADYFAMVVDPDNIYGRYGDELPKDVPGYFRNRIFPYLIQKHAEGRNVWELEANMKPEGAVITEPNSILQSRSEMRGVNKISGIGARLLEGINKGINKILKRENDDSQALPAQPEVSPKTIEGIILKRIKDQKALKEKIANNELPEILMFGDKHGQAEDLERIFKIAQRADEEGRELHIIGHGDAFDRGAENIRNWKILQELMRISQRNPRIKVDLLLGNHDTLFIDGILRKDPMRFALWVLNGGYTVLQEFGIISSEEADAFAKARDANDSLEYQKLLREFWGRNLSLVFPMAVWIFQNSKLFVIDERNFLHIHAGIPVDENGDPQITREELEQMGKELANIQREVKEDPRFFEASHNQAKVKDFFEKENVNKVLWTKRDGWLTKLTTKAKMDRLLVKLGVNGIVAAHIHRLKLLNLDNRIFIVDVEEGDAGHLLFNKEGIVFDSLDRNTRDLVASKKEILAGIDAEIARLKTMLNDKTEKKQRSEIRDLKATFTERFDRGQEISFLDLGTGVGDFVPEFKKFLEAQDYHVKKAIREDPRKIETILADVQSSKESTNSGARSFDIVTINNIESMPWSLAEQIRELLNPGGVLLVAIDQLDSMDGLENMIARKLEEAGFEVGRNAMPSDYPSYGTLPEDMRLLIAVPLQARAEMRSEVVELAERMKTKIDQTEIRAAMFDRKQNKQVPITVRLMRPSDAKKLHWSLAALQRNAKSLTLSDFIVLAAESERGIEGFAVLKVLPGESAKEEFIFAEKSELNFPVVEGLLIMSRHDEMIEGNLSRFTGVGSVLMAVTGKMILEVLKPESPRQCRMLLEAVETTTESYGDPDEFYFNIGMRPLNPRYQEWREQVKRKGMARSNYSTEFGWTAKQMALHLGRAQKEYKLKFGPKEDKQRSERWAQIESKIKELYPNTPIAKIQLGSNEGGFLRKKLGGSYFVKIQNGVEYRFDLETGHVIALDFASRRRRTLEPETVKEFREQLKRMLIAGELYLGGEFIAPKALATLGLEPEDVQAYSLDNPGKASGEDLPESTRLMRALWNGDIVELDFQQLQEDEKKAFKKISEVAGLCDVIKRSGSVPIMKAIREILKNAFVHGSKMGFSLPVFIRFDKFSGTFEVIDTVEPGPYKIEPTEDWTGAGTGLDVEVASSGDFDLHETENGMKRMTFTPFLKDRAEIREPVSDNAQRATNEKITLTLPVRQAGVDRSASNAAEGSVRSETREISQGLEVEEFLASFEGPIYYPASGTDFISIVNLGRFFPKLRNFVYADYFDLGGAVMQKVFGGALTSIEYDLRGAISMEYGSLFRKYETRVDHAKHEINIDLTYENEAFNDPYFRERSAKVRYLVSDLFKVTEPFEVVYVRYPGYAGQLAQSTAFWEHILAQTGKYLLVEESKPSSRPPAKFFKRVNGVNFHDFLFDLGVFYPRIQGNRSTSFSGQRDARSEARTAKEVSTLSIPQDTLGEDTETVLKQTIGIYNHSAAENETTGLEILAGPFDSLDSLISTTIKFLDSDSVRNYFTELPEAFRQSKDYERIRSVIARILVLTKEEMNETYLNQLANNVLEWQARSDDDADAPPTDERILQVMEKHLSEVAGVKKRIKNRIIKELRIDDEAGVEERTIKDIMDAILAGFIEELQFRFFIPHLFSLEDQIDISRAQEMSDQLFAELHTLFEDDWHKFLEAARAYSQAAQTQSLLAATRAHTAKNFIGNQYWTRRNDLADVDKSEVTVGKIMNFMPDAALRGGRIECEVDRESEKIVLVYKKSFLPKPKSENARSEVKWPDGAKDILRANIPDALRFLERWVPVLKQGMPSLAMSFNSRGASALALDHPSFSSEMIFKINSQAEKASFRLFAAIGGRLLIPALSFGVKLPKDSVERISKAYNRYVQSDLVGAMVKHLSGSFSRVGTRDGFFYVAIRDIDRLGYNVEEQMWTIVLSPDIFDASMPQELIDDKGGVEFTVSQPTGGLNHKIRFEKTANVQHRSEIREEQPVPSVPGTISETRKTEKEYLFDLLSSDLAGDFLDTKWHGTTSVALPTMLKAGAILSKKAMRERGLVSWTAMEATPLSENAVSFGRDSGIFEVLKRYVQPRPMFDLETAKNDVAEMKQEVQKLKESDNPRVRSSMAAQMYENAIRDEEQRIRAWEAMPEEQRGALKKLFDRQYPVVPGVASEDGFVIPMRSDFPEYKSRESEVRFFDASHGYRLTFIAVPTEKIEETKETIRADLQKVLPQEQLNDLVDHRVIAIDALNALIPLPAEVKDFMIAERKRQAKAMGVPYVDMFYSLSDLYAEWETSEDRPGFLARMKAYLEQQRDQQKATEQNPPRPEPRSDGRAEIREPVSGDVLSSESGVQSSEEKEVTTNYELHSPNSVPVTPNSTIKGPAVLVIEKERIDAMSHEDYLRLLVLLAKVGTQVQLVVPDAYKGEVSERSNELQSELRGRFSDRLPEIARSGKVPVFGFANDSAGALKVRLDELDERGQQISKRLNACFLLGEKLQGIILALLNVPQDQLQDKNNDGLLRDGRGLYGSQVSAFANALLQNFVAVSRSA